MMLSPVKWVKSKERQERLRWPALLCECLRAAQSSTRELAAACADACLSTQVQREGLKGEQVSGRGSSRWGCRWELWGETSHWERRCPPCTGFLLGTWEVNSEPAEGNGG